MPSSSPPRHSSSVIFPLPNAPEIVIACNPSHAPQSLDLSETPLRRVEREKGIGEAGRHPRCIVVIAAPLTTREERTTCARSAHRVEQYNKLWITRGRGIELRKCLKVMDLRISPTQRTAHYRTLRPFGSAVGLGGEREAPDVYPPSRKCAAKIGR